MGWGLLHFIGIIFGGLFLIIAFAAAMILACFIAAILFAVLPLSIVSGKISEAETPRRVQLHVVVP